MSLLEVARARNPAAEAKKQRPLNWRPLRYELSLGMSPVGPDEKNAVIVRYVRCRGLKRTKVGSLQGVMFTRNSRHAALLIARREFSSQNVRHCNGR